MLSGMYSRRIRHNTHWLDCSCRRSIGSRGYCTELDRLSYWTVGSNLYPAVNRYRPSIVFELDWDGHFHRLWDMCSRHITNKPWYCRYRNRQHRSFVGHYIVFDKLGRWVVENMIDIGRGSWIGLCSSWTVMVRECKMMWMR